MSRFVRGVAVALASALLVAAPVPGFAAASTGHTAVWTVLRSGSWTWDAAAGDSITLSESGGTIEIVMPEPGRIRITPPTGQSFAPGEYPLAQQPTETHAGIDHCLGSGTLRIGSIERGTDGAITSLSFSYDVEQCNDFGRVHRTVRYHAADDWWGVRLPRMYTDFGVLRRGQTVTRTLSVTRTGSLAATLGAATLPEGSPFAVTDNRCDDQPLAAGATCGIDVSFTAPDAGKTFDALLTIQSDSPAGALASPMHAVVNQPAPAPKDVRAVAGDDGIGLVWRTFQSHEYDQAITAWRVYRDGAADPVAEITNPWMTVYSDPAAPGETHTYTVVAVAASGTGPASAEVSATVPLVTSEPGPRSLLAIDGPAFDYAGPATPAASGLGRVSFAVPNGTLTIYPDSGAAWAPGETFGGGVQFGTTSSSCYGRGAFTVHEAKVHRDGTPVVLALSGDLDCGSGGTGHLEIRYAATRGAVAADTTPDTVDKGRVTPGTVSSATTVTVRNAGTDVLTLGAATATGTDWQVSGDTCAGRTLAAGATCTVGVRFAPTALGLSQQALEIPDSSPAGRRRIALLGRGGGAPTTPRAPAALGLTRRVVLTWTEPEIAEHGVDHYLIQRSTSATTGFATIGSANAAGLPRFVDLRRTPGQRLYYRVAAKNVYGTSAYSSVVSAVPAAREVMFTADTTGSGTYRLYSRALPSGATAPALAVEPAFAAGSQEDPAISPDGTRLLYTREPVGGGRLHLFEATIHGTEESGLAEDGAVPMTYRDPAWSPDGTRYAYSCKPVGQEWYDLCVNGPTGRKTFKNAAGAAKPSWLPNGKELLVVSAYGIDVVAADGSYRVTIPGTQNARSVTVSPDGQRMAWVRFEGTDLEPGTGETPRFSLRVSGLDAGPGTALLSTGYTNDPAWTPDGRTIYYTHTERTPTGALGTRDVYSVPVTGGTPARVTNTPDVDEDNVVFFDPAVAAPPKYVRRQMSDFTGDGRADVAVFRPGTGTWMIRGVKRVKYGRLGDVPVAADYNGDRKADIAVFRPDTSTWYVYGRTPVKYGRPGDIPVPADYNGDGRADIAVYRPSTGTWYVRDRFVTKFGRAGDVPVPADYNGDRKAEVAVYRPSGGDWLRPGRAAVDLPGVPVPADYAGTGRAQIATYLDGSFLHEALGQYDPFATAKPTAHDLPVYGNLDSSRDVEPGVFNPALGLWRLVGKANFTYGTVGDIPV